VSKHETPLTRAYWEEIGGTLIEEYCAVRKTPTTGRRLIDGVVVTDGEQRIQRGGRPSLTGHDVVCIQSKLSATVTLVGQAIFTPKLLCLSWQPRSIRTVAIYNWDDPVLTEIMRLHGVECQIVHSPDAPSRFEGASLLPLLDDYAATAPGPIARRVTLVPRSKGQPTHWVEGLMVTDGGPPIDPEEPRLAGREVTAIVTGGQGMWISGRALVMLELLRRHGVRDPRAVIVSAKRDTAMDAAMADFPAITTWTPRP
jgi:hypothetical protein